jgi:hypothetical protein
MRKLETIRVLYRDLNLSLWGLPYNLRPGQAPRNLQDAGNTAGWIWLGSPGWFGGMTIAEMDEVREYLARHAVYVPGNAYEHSTLESEAAP